MHISEYEIPKLSVSESRIVEHSSSVVIVCNLTEDAISRQRTRLKRISWYKNGELLQSVRCPDPQEPGGFLSPLDLQSVNVKDGGTYECLLEVLLRRVKNHHISKTTELRSKDNIVEYFVAVIRLTLFFNTKLKLFNMQYSVFLSLVNKTSSKINCVISAEMIWIIHFYFSNGHSKHCTIRNTDSLHNWKQRRCGSGSTYFPKLKGLYCQLLHHPASPLLKNQHYWSGFKCIWHRNYIFFL